MSRNVKLSSKKAPPKRGKLNREAYASTSGSASVGEKKTGADAGLSCKGATCDPFEQERQWRWRGSGLRRQAVPGDLVLPAEPAAAPRGHRELARPYLCQRWAAEAAIPAGIPQGARHRRIHRAGRLDRSADQAPAAAGHGREPDMSAEIVNLGHGRLKHQLSRSVAVLGALGLCIPAEALEPAKPETDLDFAERRAADAVKTMRAGDLLGSAVRWVEARPRVIAERNRKRRERAAKKRPSARSPGRNRHRQIGSGHSFASASLRVYRAHDGEAPAPHMPAS
jgi:hypothetical protein